MRDESAAGVSYLGRTYLADNSKYLPPGEGLVIYTSLITGGVLPPYQV